MFQQTVSACSTTGVWIVSISLDPSIQIPYPVYTLKVIFITNITKTFRRPCKPTTTTLCQKYLKLQQIDLHSILHASASSQDISIHLFDFLIRYILQELHQSRKKRKSRISLASTTGTTVPTEYLKLNETSLRRISHASSTALAL